MTTTDTQAAIVPTRMSADMNHLTTADLHDGVEGIISASQFIEKTAGAQLLFI